KLTKKQLKENIAHYTSELLKTWEEVPKYFISSAVDKSGQKEILDFISETNMLFQK
ncbi:MAG: YihA family ribosome biogenesis GTP-binding protein, partial [Bacteroidetes bacterium]